MRQPPSLYRSGTVSGDEHRGGTCVDCGKVVNHRRRFIGPAEQRAEEVARWKAETLRCAPHQREHMRRLAGVL